METDAQRKRPVYFEPQVEKCCACGEAVYQLERVGPINGAIYHRKCMRCHVCEKFLTMRKVKTDFRAYKNSEDGKLIYCPKHAPKTKAVGIGFDDINMQHNLKSQNITKDSRKGMNDQIRGAEPGKPTALTSDALQISGPVEAQRYVQRRNKVGGEKHNFPGMYRKKRELLTRAQRELEQKQRAEEDKMYEQFKEQRSSRVVEIANEVDEEWEIKLKELTKRFEKETKKKSKKDDAKSQSLRFEKEKEDLAKTMTIKRKSKMEYSTLKLKEEEKRVAAEMVKEHSKQMLSLIAAKRQELIDADDDDKDEEDVSPEEDDHDEPAAEEVPDELEPVPPPVSDVNQNTEIVKKDAPVPPPAESPKRKQRAESPVRSNGGDGVIFMPVVIDGSPPPPKPPSCSKSDLYTDPIVFKDLDEEVFNIAENDQQTFTDLVDQLTSNCTSELEKVRAIFRWITVKDLNVMELDEDEPGGDTPHNLLRGIKTGTETYHVLFMRLCSFAGLHCVEIKGHSKSVGYEPGMRIQENTFLNTWNAVHVDGDWRIIQCNWGARHLVLNKDSKHVETPKDKKDKIRYQYDEHYFLTDPSDFILEFWPFEPEWQLLEQPISLEQFEQLPFVRSIFFHHNMQLEAGTKAVMMADDKGGAQLKLRVPPELVHDLVFHYQLRFADEQKRDMKEFKGTRLERFVYQTTVDHHIIFSIHVPAVGEYFLEIFSNKINDSNRLSDDPKSTMQPFRLKCACKFRLVCTKMSGKMHPLPDCASGEWGPMKGMRHFNLQPITHEGGVINEENDLEIKLGCPRPLEFVTKLHCNHINDDLMEEFVDNKLDCGILTVNIRPPVTGQYGLDIFARPLGAVSDSNTLAHACKYLVNIAHVDNPKQLPPVESAPAAKITKDKLGAVGRFKELGIKMVSHPEYRIHTSNNPLVMELSFSEPLQFSYHLLKEPDEDHREQVSMNMNTNSSPSIVEFTINFPSRGNYLFAIYSREKGKQDKMMANVCNYLITHMAEPSVKEKRRNSSSGIMSIFGKNKSIDKS